MNRRNYLHRMVVIPLAITVYALLGCSEMDDPSQDITQTDMATFAGYVVDTEGEPVAKLSLFMQYIRPDDEGLQPKFDWFSKTETDEVGRFSFTDINPGQLQLVLVPYYEPHRYDDMKYRLFSVRIGEVVYYPNESSPYVPSYRASFSVTPGARVEDVEVTVKPRMRIQGKIVFRDGTPLANWTIHLKNAI